MSGSRTTLSTTFQAFAPTREPYKVFFQPSPKSVIFSVTSFLEIVEPFLQQIFGQGKTASMESFNQNSSNVGKIISNWKQGLVMGNIVQP